MTVEPYWNLKEINIPEPPDSVCMTVEPYWNLKEDVFDDSNFLLSYDSRTILEFKVGIAAGALETVEMTVEP